MNKILRILLSIIYFIFAVILMGYALTILSFMFEAKNSNAVQNIIIFIQYEIIPIAFYLIGAVALSQNKAWSWGFVFIGGIVVILLTINVLPLRPFYIGLYVLSFITYLVNTGGIRE